MSVGQTDGTTENSSLPAWTHLCLPGHLKLLTCAIYNGPKDNCRCCSCCCCKNASALGGWISARFVVVVALLLLLTRADGENIVLVVKLFEGCRGGCRWQSVGGYLNVSCVSGAKFLSKYLSAISDISLAFKILTLSAIWRFRSWLCRPFGVARRPEVPWGWAVSWGRRGWKRKVALALLLVDVLVLVALLL